MARELMFFLSVENAIITSFKRGGVMRGRMIMVFVLLAFAITAWSQTVTINSITSDLPRNWGGAGDKYASEGQVHNVTVNFTIAGVGGTLPADTRLQLRTRNSCGGAYGGQTTVDDSDFVGYANGTYDWVIPVTEPLCGTSSQDQFRDSLRVRNRGTGWGGGGITFDANGQDRKILVEDSTHIEIISVKTQPADGINDYQLETFTAGEDFVLEIVYENTGRSRARRCTLFVADVVSPGSDVVLNYTDKWYIGNVTYGNPETLYVPIDNSSGNHGIIGIDDTFTVTVYAEDRNTQQECNYTYTDNEAYASIVLEPELSLYLLDPVYAPAYSGAGIPWLNNWDETDFYAFVVSADGDYAIADSLDFWSLGGFLGDLQFGAVHVDGIDIWLYVQPYDMTGTPVDFVAPGDTVFYWIYFLWDAVTISVQDTVDYYHYCEFHNQTRHDEAEPSTSPYDTTVVGRALIDLENPVINPIEPFSGSSPWPVDDTLRTDVTDNFAGVESVKVWIENVATGAFWDGCAWIAGPPIEFDLVYNTTNLQWQSDVEVLRPTAQFVFIVEAWDSAANTDGFAFLNGCFVHDIVSTLPYEEPFPLPDYYANKNQTHQCSVWVGAQYDIPADDDTLRLYQFDCTGSPSLVWEILLPAMVEGETLVFIFDVTEPNCIPDYFNDSLWAIIAGPDASPDVNDNDLIIEVQRPAEITMLNVHALASDAPAVYVDRTFTQNQNFFLEIEVENTGIAEIQDITFHLDSWTPYDVTSIFDSDVTFYNVNIPAAGTEIYYIPIIADPDHHGTVGIDDEVFSVWADAIDRNDLTIADDFYTDDDDTIDVQMPSDLHICDVDFDAGNPFPSGLLNDWLNNVYWLNGIDFLDMRFALESTHGDYATADSLDLFDAFIEFFHDVIPAIGIDGIDAPLAILDYFTLVPIDELAPGDTAMYVFRLTDIGVPPWFEDTLGNSFQANFHDKNRADANFASTSPFDTLMNTILVDVLPPICELYVPNAPSPWPGDNILWATATDNHSCVEHVHCFLQNGANGWYYNGTTWQAGYFEFDFTHDAMSGDWYLNLNEPVSTAYVIETWPVDSAGNVGYIDRMPRGDVACIHIQRVISDLHREVVPEQVWEADWLQEHNCTVWVYNEYHNPIDNVVIGLHSTAAHTVIDGDLGPNLRFNFINIGTMAPLADTFLTFDVQEAMYDLADTLIAYLVSADPVGGYVVGQIYTDDDALIIIQEPAQHIVYEVWNDAPYYIDDAGMPTDTGIVTWDNPGFGTSEAQDFKVYAKICYMGVDTAEYLRMFIDNTSIPSNIDVSPTGPTTYEIAHADFSEMIVDPVYGIIYCATIDFDFWADDNFCSNRMMDDAFVVDFDSIKYDNWPELEFNPYIQQQYFEDVATYITVVEAPQLDITDADYDSLLGGHHNQGFYWLNKYNSIYLEFPFVSVISSCCDDDRATADLYGEHAYLEFFNPVYGSIGGLVGLEYNYTSPGDTLFPTATDMAWFTVSWDGATIVNEYIDYIEGYIDFSNLYWPSQLYPVPWLFICINPVTLNPVYISPEMDTISKYIYATYDPFAIDVVDPLVAFEQPIPDVYNEWNWPDTFIVNCTDNFSQVDTYEVWGLIQDPRGWTWNGTAWVDYDNWLNIGYAYDDRWWMWLPGVPDLVAEGIYELYAYCYDVAGNYSDTVFESLIFDSTSSWTWITEPDPYDLEVFYKCPEFDEIIKAQAWDTLDHMDYSEVAGVQQAYVAIEETLDHLWWDEVLYDWVTSPDAIYNPMIYEADEVWYYNDWTNTNTSYVFRVYTYAIDQIYNFDSPTDSIMIVVDCDDPICYLTDMSFTTAPTDSVFSTDPAVPIDWTSIMNDEIWGYVVDTITAVDSIWLSIRKDDTLWWNEGIGDWVDTPTQLWFEPDFVWDVAPFVDLLPQPELHPGYQVLGKDTVWFEHYWYPDGPGCYDIYVKAWDDVANESPADYSQFDATYTWWRFAVDHMQHDYIEAMFPMDDSTYLIWEWHDVFDETLRVAVYDTSIGCLGWFNNIDSAQIALQLIIGGIPHWWHDNTWSTSFEWTNLELGTIDYEIDGSDTLAAIFNWWMWIPVTAMQNGVYNAQVQAWTQTGQIVTYYYNFILLGDVGYLTMEVISPTPVFACDPVQVELAAHYMTGDINTSFMYGVHLYSNYTDPGCIDPFYAGTYYLSGGIDTLVIHPCCGREDLILWAESPASGYDLGNALPFDVISALDPDIYAALEDVPDDQGNQIMIIHTRSNCDPLYGGVDIDTTTLKVTGYEYQRLNGFWGDITEDLITESNDTLYFYYTPADFDINDYRLIINYRTDVDAPGFVNFDTFAVVPLGSIAAHDDIAPADVADLWIEQVGAQVHLWWNEVTLGWEGSPELQPDDNMQYIVYHGTGNPYDPAIYTDIDTVDEPAFWEDLPTFPVESPTYYYVTAFDHDENLSGESEIVGRVSYDFVAGWVHFSVPFDIEFGSLPLKGSELVDYLTPVAIDTLRRFDNVVHGWVSVYWEPAVDGDIVEGTDVLTAHCGAVGTYSIAGDLPPTQPVYTFTESTWVSMFVPLNRPDLIMASDLIDEIPYCSALGNMFGGWTNFCVVFEGGGVYGDFPINPGLGCVAWTDDDGTWPTVKSSGFDNRLIESNLPTVDFVAMPKALVGDIDGEWETVHFALSTKDGNVVLTDDDPGCVVRDGKFMVQLGNIDWNEGNIYILKLYTEDGSTSDDVVIAIDNSPAQHLGNFYLKEADIVPVIFALHKAIPNPFNAATEIKFDLPAESDVEIVIYDMNGTQVRTVVSDNLPIGFHKVRWDGSNDTGNELPTGIYFCRMKAGEFTARTKLILVK